MWESLVCQTLRAKQKAGALPAGLQQSCEAGPADWSLKLFIDHSGRDFGASKVVRLQGPSQVQGPPLLAGEEDNWHVLHF